MRIINPGKLALFYYSMKFYTRQTKYEHIHYLVKKWRAKTLSLLLNLANLHL